ncbi:MAG: class I SAM-dependent methyltransferase [Patescibacteria group bacterium]
MYSGERILPEKIFNVTYQQSLKAYEYAATYAAGKTVLDVASGEGYGTHLLGKTAAKAVGLDLHRGAVEDAQKNYGNTNVVFHQGDLLNAPAVLKGEQFDVVCCFQTIEHVEDHDAFLASLAAVARPGGIILVSTPNKKVFPSFNPYHVHELDYNEIHNLFARNFQESKIYGVFGDEAVMRYRESKQKVSDAILRIDFLQARNWLPRKLLLAIYAFVSYFLIKKISFLKHAKEITHITTDNFAVRENYAKDSLDFIAVAWKKA